MCNENKHPLAKKKAASVRVPPQAPGSAPFYWPRSDPEALAKFDPDSKICTMNCGSSTHDPRSKKECKFQCTDCITVQPNNKVRNGEDGPSPVP
jgi:hypothetical protein